MRSQESLWPRFLRAATHKIMLDTSNPPTSPAAHHGGGTDSGFTSLKGCNGRIGYPLGCYHLAIAIDADWGAGDTRYEVLARHRAQGFGLGGENNTFGVQRPSPWSAPNGSGDCGECRPGAGATAKNSVNRRRGTGSGWAFNRSSAAT